MESKVTHLLSRLSWELANGQEATRLLLRALRRVALRVLCALSTHTCAGTLADGGEDGVLVRWVSRLAARYMARVAATATEWAVNMRWLRVAQQLAVYA